MKASDFKKIIKESVREVIKEEIADILYEGIKSMQSGHQVPQRDYSTPVKPIKESATSTYSSTGENFSPMSGIKKSEIKKGSASALGSILQETAASMGQDDFEDVAVGLSNPVMAEGNVPSQAPTQGDFMSGENNQFLDRVHAILEKSNTIN